MNNVKINKKRILTADRKKWERMCLTCVAIESLHFHYPFKSLLHGFILVVGIPVMLSAVDHVCLGFVVDANVNVDSLKPCKIIALIPLPSQRIH